MAVKRSAFAMLGNPADSERSLVRFISSLGPLDLVSLKDISGTVSVIEHLCDSHIDRPAILQRSRTVVNLD